MQYQHGQCVIAVGLRYRAYALYLRVGIGACACVLRDTHLVMSHVPNNIMCVA